MKLKLVKVDISSIERNGSDLEFHFDEGAIVVVNDFTEFELENSHPISIRCASKNNKLEMLCYETYIFYKTINTVEQKEIYQESARLLENETFQLLMHVDYEEYFEMENDVLSELEVITRQNAIDLALKNKDKEAFDKLVANYATVQ